MVAQWQVYEVQECRLLTLTISFARTVDFVVNPVVALVAPGPNMPVVAGQSHHELLNPARLAGSMVPCFLGICT